MDLRPTQQRDSSINPRLQSGLANYSNNGEQGTPKMLHNRTSFRLFGLRGCLRPLPFRKSPLECCFGPVGPPKRPFPLMSSTVFVDTPPKLPSPPDHQPRMQAEQYPPNSPQPQSPARETLGGEKLAEMQTGGALPGASLPPVTKQRVSSLASRAKGLLELINGRSKDWSNRE